MTDQTFLIALGALALASYACRVSGFLLMRYVTITPRIEAALRAAPGAVMVGIATPALSSGKPPEMIALAAVLITMRLTRNDLIASVVGVAAVAVARTFFATA